MKTILSAAAALALAVGGAAFADSGDGPQFGVPVPVPVPATGPVTTVVTAAPLVNDVGNERPAVFASQRADIAQALDALLPAAGNEAIVQTASSAPRGFADGTLAMPTVQAGHQAVSPTLAQR